VVSVVNEVFTKLQIDSLHKIVDNFLIPTVNRKYNGKYVSSKDNVGTGVCEELGRLQIKDISTQMTEESRQRINEIAKSITDAPITLKHSMYVEYNNKYGNPNLPPHFDRDNGDLIINYQLSSNTHWNIGVGLNRYDLEDNSAVVFNGNTDMHWRDQKQFKNNEYVKMIFFRFYNKDNPSDYSKSPGNQSDEVFAEAVRIRGRLK
jgi:hypothetical protein